MRPTNFTKNRVWKGKKRNESSLVTACLNWLQCQENLGNIAYVDRMNSGRISGVRLHRAGCSDIIIILNDGRVVWCECKTEKGVIRDSQIDFEKVIQEIPNHFYIVVRSLDELVDKLKLRQNCAGDL